jgi:putative hydrolase of the HAD superfamily
MHFKTLLIDLDDTLYPSDSGLWFAIRSRMNDYMVERLKFPKEYISEIRQRYLETYGTTLRGLQHEFDIDADDFLSFVHDLPLDQYLSPNPNLRKMLLSLPQKRWIFTNADTFHAQRVLAVLRLDDCFDGIIDIRALNFLCKPDEAAYLKALQIIAVENTQHTVMFDDSLRNLLPAQKLGFFTVLVGPEEDHPDVDLSLPSLLDLPEVMPELWDQRSFG